MAGEVKLTANIPAEVKGISFLWRLCGISYIIAVPHIIVLCLKGIVFDIFALISMFTILFSGTVPEGMWNFMTKYIRHLYYVSAWLLNFGGKYPKFDGEVDPDQPLQVEFVRPDKWRSLFGLLRMCGIVLLTLVPHIIIMFFWGFWVTILIVIGMIAGLFTGKWNESSSKTIVNFIRFEIRVICYIFCITDTYPPMNGKE